ncbi:TlpA family protein disulfide reductase [Saccharicrinis aurantiacus]|uniref:TlpA family protein disulfide reductase n=1 Tax=Saccharicrinis aurantiacus TaxID=1849719 RepID=UPI0009500832|nr:TlpA disulfide reductase family protein [Saccharicrinis aurantiacus]
MRINILIIFLSFFSISKSQKDFQQVASEQAGKMIEAWNKKNSRDFVECLTHSQYDNKEKFIEIWENVMTKDSRILTNLELIKFIESNNTQQAYFSLSFGGKKCGIIGISIDNGITWHFTQPIVRFNYSQLKESFIPELDTSFISFDEDYKSKINFEIGTNLKQFKFEKLDGDIVEIRNYEGKVVVLNFWNTSCGPCVAEIPRLNELSSSMNNKNVVFIAPALQQKNKELITSFLDKHPFNYEVVFCDFKKVNINYMPTHIILNKNLEVIAKLIGGNAENIVKMERILKSL